MHLHYSTLFMLTPITNLSGKELEESVIFQPILQAYPTCHSWIITAHVSLGHLELHWKAFNRQLARTWQLLHYLDQQPSAPTQLLPMLQVELTNIVDIYNSFQNHHNICNEIIRLTLLLVDDHSQTFATGGAYYPSLEMLSVGSLELPLQKT